MMTCHALSTSNLLAKTIEVLFNFFILVGDRLLCISTAPKLECEPEINDYESNVLAIVVHSQLFTEK